jgi:aspartate aminotransferase
VPTFIETDSSFKISAEQFADAITPRTRAIVVNSPANPTGAVYSKDELEGIAQVAVDKDVIVISDEIYEKIIYDGAVHVSIASLGSEIKERCFVVNGVSKTYAMTGWRIGYVAGDKEAIAAAGRLLDQSTSNACSIAQRASIAALTGGDETVKAMVAEFDKRRRFIHKRANEVFQADAPLPKGAFYFFADVSSLLGKKYKGRTLESSMDVADFMLDEARVAGVPGGAFGADSYMRLSYACSMEEITEGMDRVEKAITVLS